MFDSTKYSWEELSGENNKLLGREPYITLREPPTPIKHLITYMNFEILLQLAAILFVFAAGPLVIILLASRSGNL